MLKEIRPGGPEALVSSPRQVVLAKIRSPRTDGFEGGWNLFVLSARFPDIEFSGIELTASGVGSIEAVREMPELPTAIAKFSPLPPVDLTTHKSVQVQQASAAELPFDDKSFDVVFTSSALEQMEAVRDPALGEIARVARGHVVMTEPFFDVNSDGMRRHRITCGYYFQGSIAELPKHGLKPIFVTGDLPAKIAEGIAVVVAEKVGNGN
jgi:SAM-dependent methyltransferase